MVNLNRLLAKIEDFDQKAYRLSLEYLDKGLILSIPRKQFLKANRILKLENKFDSNEFLAMNIPLEEVKNLIFNMITNIRRNQLVEKKILFKFDNIQVTRLLEYKDHVRISLKIKSKDKERIGIENLENIFCSEEYFEECIQYSSLVYYQDELVEIQSQLRDFKIYLESLKEAKNEYR